MILNLFRTCLEGCYTLLKRKKKLKKKMSKKKKFSYSAMNSHLEQIIDSIITQKAAIIELQRVRDEAALCSRSYQHDISEIQQFIYQIRQEMNYYSPSHIPLSSPSKIPLPPRNPQETTNPQQNSDFLLFSKFQQQQNNNLNNTQNNTLNNNQNKENTKQQEIKHIDKVIRRVIDRGKTLETQTSEKSFQIQSSSENMIVEGLTHNKSNRSKRQFTITRTEFLKVNEIVCCAQFVNGGNFFMFATCTKLYLYDTLTKACLKDANIPFDSDMSYEKLTRTLCVSHNGHLCAVCAADFSITLFSIPTLDIISTLHGPSATAAYLCFFHDDKKLVSSGQYGVLTIWSLPSCTMHARTSVGDSRSIVNICISQDDSKIITTCSDGYISILDTSLSQQYGIYHVIPSFIFSSSLSPTNQIFATALRNNNVHLFTLNLENDTLLYIASLVGHSDFVVCVEFSPDGSLLFTGSKDESIKVWDVDSLCLLSSLPLGKNTIFCICHHPTEPMFLSCTGDGEIVFTTYKLT